MYIILSAIISRGREKHPATHTQSPFFFHMYIYHIQIWWLMRRWKSAKVQKKVTEQKSWFPLDLSVTNYTGRGKRNLAMFVFLKMNGGFIPLERKMSLQCSWIFSLQNLWPYASWACDILGPLKREPEENTKKGNPQSQQEMLSLARAA